MFINVPPAICNDFYRPQTTSNGDGYCNLKYDAWLIAEPYFHTHYLHVIPAKYLIFSNKVLCHTKSEKKTFWKMKNVCVSFVAGEWWSVFIPANKGKMFSSLRLECYTPRFLWKTDTLSFSSLQVNRVTDEYCNLSDLLCYKVDIETRYTLSMKLILIHVRSGQVIKQTFEESGWIFRFFIREQNQYA